MRRPSDYGARREIVEERRRNVVVEASAGTGKTTLLVERVVDLVRDGTDLESLAVVTFTEAAASELRGRIRHGLAEAGLTEALRRLPLARISTIHGFASFVLRSYSHITGVDPSFETVEAHFAGPELAARWDRYLASLPASKVEEMEPLLEAAGTGRLLELAEQVESTWWLSDLTELGDHRAILEYLREAAPAETSLLFSRPSARCSSPDDKLLPDLQGVERLLQSLAGSDPPTPEEAQEALGAVNLSRGSAASWGGKQALEEVKGALRTVRDLLKKSLPALLRGAEASEVLDSVLMPFVRRLRADWEGDVSRLSYQDLLVRCTRALSKSPGLRRQLGERFSHLLVDEFQDTSGLQVELFSSFLAEAGRAFGPGRITVVGDPKQSIYGWRSADVETYKSTLAALEEAGALSSGIVDNFRSTRRVIEFVNVFGRLLFAAQSPEELPYGCRYSPLTAFREEEGPPVRVVEVKAPEEGDLKSDLSAETMADWIAADIRRKVDGGALPGHCAILMRRSSKAQAMVDALELQGLEASLAMRSDFSRRLELVDLREMVRCLTAPGDARAWVHTLRSSFFGIGDPDITAAIAAGCRGMDDAGAEVLPRPVREANRMLRRLRAAAVELPLADFLYQLLLSTDMIAGVEASGYSVERRLGSLATVLEMAMEGTIGSCQELLAHLTDRAPGGGRPDPAIPRPDMQAVTIATIYRSKGLAYPHVYLVETAFGRNTRKDVLLRDLHARRAAVYLSGELQTPAYPLLELQEGWREAAETRRLFYVAATRPRTSLTVLVAGDDAGGDTMQTLREPLLEAVRTAPEGVCRHVEVEAAPMHRRRASRPELDPASSPGRVPPETEPVFEATEPEVEDTPAERLGTLVHAVLERIDHADPEGWVEDNEELLESVCESMCEEASRLALRFFGMELPFDLESCRVVGREYPLVVTEEGRPQERYIDLLLEDGEGLIVVDYKTDRVPEPEKESLDRLAEHYRGQQEGYLEAVRRAFDRPARGYLVFLAAGAVRRIEG